MNTSHVVFEYERDGSTQMSVVWRSRGDRSIIIIMNQYLYGTYLVVKHQRRLAVLYAACTAHMSEQLKVVTARVHVVFRSPFTSPYGDGPAIFTSSFEPHVESQGLSY